MGQSFVFPFSCIFSLIYYEPSRGTDTCPNQLASVLMVQLPALQIKGQIPALLFKLGGKFTACRPVPCSNLRRTRRSLITACTSSFLKALQKKRKTCLFLSLGWQVPAQYYYQPGIIGQHECTIPAQIGKMPQKGYTVRLHPYPATLRCHSKSCIILLQINGRNRHGPGFLFSDASIQQIELCDIIRAGVILLTAYQACTSRSH